MDTKKHLFRVERHEINYLRITIESYDGMAIVRTIDPYEAIIELCIAPECEDLIFELLESFRKKEGIKIEKIFKKTITQNI